MRTITKIHDYYDGLMRSDEDDKIVFMRNTSEVPFAELDIDTKRTQHYKHWHGSAARFDYFLTANDDEVRRWDGKVHSSESFVVGFCGKIYTGLRVKRTNGLCVTAQGYKKTNEILYGDDMIEYLEHISADDCENHSKSHWPWQFTHYAGTAAKIRDAMTLMENGPLKELFIRYRVPYFVMEDYVKCTLLPVLKDYQFYKVFDAYQTYQEVRMFVEGNLAQDTQVVVPVGGDLIVRDSKGFDKHSFRKDKQDKKQKRRKHRT